MRLLLTALVGLGLAAQGLVVAPAAQARGAADCFRVTGQQSLLQSGYYEVRIEDKCGFGNSSPDSGVRVLYQIDLGFYCTTRTGTVTRGSFGATERIDTSCLTPGFHTPKVRLSSFADGSSNYVTLPFITIREPEKPSLPRPTPTPTPTRTPAPTQTTAPPTPAPTSPTIAPSATAVSKDILPGAGSAFYTTKRRGTGKPTARLENGLLTVNIKTKLKPGSEFSVEVLGPVGIGNVPVTKPSGVTETRAYRDWYNFPVGRKGKVSFTVPVTSFNDINVRDQRGRMFLRVHTSPNCSEGTVSTLTCSDRG